MNPTLVNTELASTTGQPILHTCTLPLVEKRPDRVLVAEHRDEVFAFLALSLSESGHLVFRAKSADEVSRFFSFGNVEFIFYNVDLPCDDAWMQVKKRRIFDAYARVCVYVPWASKMHEPGLSRIERVVYYHGDLFFLEENISQIVNQTTNRPARDWRQAS